MRVCVCVSADLGGGGGAVLFYCLLAQSASFAYLGMLS